MKNFLLEAGQSLYYKPLHMVSRRQQRLRLARRKQIIKKTKSLLIENDCSANIYAKNEVQHFNDCNVNHLVQDTQFNSIVQLSTNEQSSDLYTDNIDEVKVRNTCNTVMFQKNLAAVLVDANHVLGNRILKLLRTHNCFTFLPADIRSLLLTPRHSSILYKVEPGEYLHIGVKKMFSRNS